MSPQIFEQNQTEPSAQGRIAIGVFIKAPSTGSSKTRLCPPLNPHERAALSRCFFQDTAENISTVSLEKEDIIGVAIYTPVGSEQEIQCFLPNGFLLIPQRGESLGDRLHNAFEDLFSAGFDSVCMIGSDSPTLPPSYVRQMVDYLSRSKDGVVIGPTADGGYYAIGLKAPRRCLFEGIDWSTDRVFEQTNARVAELALPQMTLPVWYDVDDGAALERLLEELCCEERIGKPSSAYPAIRTQRLLNSILRTDGYDFASGQLGSGQSESF